METFFSIHDYNFKYPIIGTGTPVILMQVFNYQKL